MDDPRQIHNGNPTPQYRIGDYARYLGVTPDFLKHYEQFRVVSSEQRENGYRYYPFSQSFKILECMRLRNYGMPIREIDVALVDDSADAVMDKLDARIEALERQIRFEQALVREHRTTRVWFDRIKNKQEDWFVSDGEETLFLPHTSQRNFLKDPQIYDILSDWLALMPLVKSSLRIPNPAAPAQQDYAWGLIVPASLAAVFALPMNDAVIRLPARKTLYYPIFNQEWPQIDPGNFRQSNVHRHLSRLGLTPTGDIYMTTTMYTHVSDKAERYGYYAVPID